MIKQAYLLRSQIKYMCRLLAAGLVFAGAAGAAYSQDKAIPVADLTIQDLQAGYASAAYTAEEVTQAFLNRIEEYEPSYNAFTFIAEDALAQARAIDKRRAAGEALGPLAGVPLIIKESIDVKGYPSTAGWKALSPEMGGLSLVPPTDAPLVERLRRAGAIILGKGNMPQFALGGRTRYSWDGLTYNSVKRDITTSGSSAGVATAVAAGFVVAGIGEESSGSIQNPSAAQALVGIKPTFGLVPSAGIVPLGGSTVDVAGPMAKNVYDAALILDSLVGYTSADPKTLASVGQTPEHGYVAGLKPGSLKGKRIGFYGDSWRHQPLTDEVKAMYDKTLAELKARGAVLVADPFKGSNIADIVGKEVVYQYLGQGSALPHDLEIYLNRFGEDAPIHSYAGLKKALGFDPFLTSRLSFTTTWKQAKSPDELMALLADFTGKEVYPEAIAPKPEDYINAPDISTFVKLREKYLRIFNKVMDEHNLDALVYPQIWSTPPTLEEKDGWPAVATTYVNVIGLPGVTVPAGYFENGSPYAAIFVGRMWSEAELLSLAYDYEQATKHRKTPKLVKVAP